MNSTDMDVLRDLLQELGVRGAQHVTVFHLAVLGDLLCELNNAQLVEGGWPRRRSRSVREFHPRSDWALARHRIAYGKTVDQLHSMALDIDRELAEGRQ